MVGPGRHDNTLRWSWDPKDKRFRRPDSFVGVDVRPSRILDTIENGPSSVPPWRGTPPWPPSIPLLVRDSTLWEPMASILECQEPCNSRIHVCVSSWCRSFSCSSGATRGFDESNESDLLPVANDETDDP